MHRSNRLLWLLLITIATAPAAAESAPTPSRVVEAYLSAIGDQRWDEARALWSPEYLADSKRLGITYLDQPCAWDLASAPVLARQALRDGTAVATCDLVEQDDATATVLVQVRSADTTHVTRYGLLHAGDTWQLVNPIWLAGRSWSEHTTDYCRLYVQRDGLLNDIALAELDRFVAETVRCQGAGDDRLAELRRVKIPYYLADEATVAELTGYPTKGMADLAAGAVISSHFPHFHELAHLLVNWALKEVPLYTLPWLQEGVACRLGGRWGRSPEVILYMGRVNLDLAMVTPAEVLTWSGFRQAPAGPDATYGAGALLCDLVVSEAGWPALLDLYRAQSGDLAAVSGWTDHRVADAVGRACGWTGPTTVPALIDSVVRHSERRRRCGIVPGPPVDASSAAVVTEADGVHIRRAGSVLEVAVAGETWPVVLVLDDRPPDHRQRPAQGASTLFQEYLPDTDWRGERWGLVCHRRSVGFYDFGTNRLMGTWVADFSGEILPADESGRLVFTLAGPDPRPGGPIWPEDLGVRVVRP